jgi:hypothetical protein
MSILLILYILSVLVSGVFLWRIYFLEGLFSEFSFLESILRLVIVPLIPVVNLLLAYIQYQTDSDPDSVD